jgi:hypothetical protein
MTTALAILSLVVIALTVVGWRRVMSADRPLLLGQMLLRQGAKVPELTALTGRELGRAVRRCTLCTSTERCSTWLAKDESHGYEAFCPNAGFIEELKRVRP